MKLPALIACALSLNAQMTVTPSRAKDGSTTVEIRNTGAIPFAAFAAVFQVAGEERAQFVFMDALTDATPPKQEFTTGPSYREVPRQGNAVIPPLAGPIRTAALFADGTATGDEDLIRRMLLRRCSKLQAVETSLEMIADAGRHNVSRSRMLADFKRMAESVRRWYLPPEQQAGAPVYQSIVGKLLNLPEGPLGSAFPPAAFVAEQTAVLNGQRTALLAARPSLADADGYTHWNANRRP